MYKTSLGGGGSKFSKWHQNPLTRLISSHLYRYACLYRESLKAKLERFFNPDTDRRIGTQALTANTSSSLKFHTKRDGQFDPLIEGTRGKKAQRVQPFPNYIERALEDLELEAPKFEGDVPNFLRTLTERKFYYDKHEARLTNEVVPDSFNFSSVVNVVEHNEGRIKSSRRRDGAHESFHCREKGCVERLEQEIRERIVSIPTSL